MVGGTVLESHSWKWQHLGLKVGVSDSLPVLCTTPWGLFNCLEACHPKDAWGEPRGGFREEGMYGLSRWIRLGEPLALE